MNDVDWKLAWHLITLKVHRRFKVIVAHRKAKKTLLAIKELDRWAQAVSATYWHVFPTLAQGKKTVWDDPDMYQRNVLPYAWEHRNNSDHYLLYPNGSKVYLLGARNPDDLRGPNPLGVVLDEYDDMLIQVWSAIIQPIMRANSDAWCWFMGTYKGKKDLYAKQQFALENPDQWFQIVVKASESGIIEPDALEEARRTTPQAFFDMEYECIPIEGGTSYFTRVRENLWHGGFGDPGSSEFKSGVDLAKFNDWTVLTPVEVTERVVGWGEKDRFRVGIPERFNQVDWPLQKARIAAFWGRYNKCALTVDATGVGGPIVDDLRNDGIKPLEAVTFTEKQRMDLLRNLSVMLANDQLMLPEYEPLLEELEAFAYDVNKRGRVYIAVPEGQHDDCVMSLALAVWGIKKKKPQSSYQTTSFHDNTDDLWNMDQPKGMTR